MKQKKLALNIDPDQSIAISEIFGPTLQGEGIAIGTPCLFVRTAGCDFLCRWCDTLYAVAPTYKHNWQTQNAHAILKKLQELAPPPFLVVLSGGNPALQPLDALIAMGTKQGYRFSIETQGSRYADWFSLLAQITISPKPPSAQVAPAKALNACLQHAGEIATQLKIVVDDYADYQFAKALHQQYPTIPMTLQACHHPNTDSLPKERQIAQWVLDDRLSIRVLPQWHKRLWGEEQGR